MNGAPLSNELMNRATEAIKLLGELSMWFNESISEALKEHIPQMLSILHSKFF